MPTPLTPAPLDLNCDLGEGFGSWRCAADDSLLDVVTSANIACGFHAGDPTIMRRTCERAVAAGVRIGAHIGYRDLVGFGRRALNVAPDDLEQESLYQIGALDAIAAAAGDRVRYVKPHGALYHSATADRQTARAIVAALRAYRPELALLGPPDSELAKAAADADVMFHAEGFADRRYLPTGALVPRSAPGAVLDSEAAVRQALSIAATGTVSADDGSVTAVPARSLCVHGDTPDALTVVTAVRASLTEAGCVLRAFT